MNVYVNNKQMEIAKEEKISSLLKQINIVEPKGIAVAVNNAVIPKVNWEEFVFQENDKVTVIRATQGG